MPDLKLVKTLYTLIRHSGFTVGQNPHFEHAVELQSINERDAETVYKAGGLVFGGYQEASEREYRENYPSDHRGGLIPRVKGSFIRRAGIGEIYRPASALAQAS